MCTELGYLPLQASNDLPGSLLALLVPCRLCPGSLSTGSRPLLRHLQKQSIYLCS
jgi:hypothetical protein